MNLYFDNAAAMELLPQISAGTFTGNQESPVSGMAAVVADAGKRILRTLKLDPSQYTVQFTHTGTDAVCAVFQILSLKNDAAIAYSGGEHACIRAAVARTGLKKQIVPCDQDGVIMPEDLAATLSKQTGLVALHAVQPETGVIQDLTALRKVIPPETLFLADAVQGVGKIPMDAAAIAPDFLIISGQKLGIPSGAAVICKKKFEPAFRKLRLEEHRIGRVPPVFSQMLADALEIWQKNGREWQIQAQNLKQLFFSDLEKRIGTKFRKTLRETTACSPFIAHILLQNGVQGAIVTRALSQWKIITAPGSACDAETKEPSAALQWMKIRKDELWSGLRISFSPLNDEKGVLFLTEKLAEFLQQY